MELLSCYGISSWQIELLENITCEPFARQDDEMAKNLLSRRENPFD